MNRSTRQIFLFLFVLAGAAILIWLRVGFAENSRMTAEKVAEFANSKQLVALTGNERAQALRELEDEVNGLSLVERRKWWLAGHWRPWFDQMTEIEKSRYIDATLPTGLTQVLNAFENLPTQSRQQAIDDAMRKLKQTHQLVIDHEPGHPENMYGTNASPVLSPELENRARMLGFKTFYAESSAETKAELAPFVEELQNQLEIRPASGQ